MRCLTGAKKTTVLGTHLFLRRAPLVAAGIKQANAASRNHDVELFI